MYRMIKSRRNNKNKKGKRVARTYRKRNIKKGGSAEHHVSKMVGDARMQSFLAIDYLFNNVKI